MHFFFSFCIVVIAFIIIKKESQKDEFIATIKKLHEENKISEFTKEFMHDYRATLFSLILYIKENKNEQALALLKSLTNYTNEITKNDFNSQISRIALPSIQSVLFQKLITLKNKNINVHLNIPYPIGNLPIDEIDYIRVLSIIIDNAGEATEKSTKPLIDIYITESQIKIENTVESQNHLFTLQDYTKKNISTKDGHTGLGLFILSKILRRYAQTSYQIESYSKKFIIRIQFNA